MIDTPLSPPLPPRGLPQTSRPDPREPATPPVDPVTVPDGTPADEPRHTRDEVVDRGVLDAFGRAIVAPLIPEAGEPPADPHAGRNAHPPPTDPGR